MSLMLSNLLNAMKEIWANIGIAQRTSIILIILGTIAAVVGVVYMGTRPDWQPLYTDLPAKTAAEVYAMIKEGGTPVKTQNGGRTILVPAQYVDDLKQQVTLKGIEGIDSGTLSKGFNIFDVKRIGMSQDEWHMMKQRAVQGELEQMIAKFDGVSTAKVVLNLPKRRAFNRGSGNRPSASVTVAMKQRGSLLTAGQINSVRSLVSGAVEEMEMCDVTVIDGRSGKLLAERMDPDEVEDGIGGTHMSRRSQIERSIEQKAEAILARLVGDDNVVAIASLELDFDKINEISEKFDATGAIIRSERTTTEEISKTADTPGGATGTATNIKREVPIGKTGIERESSLTKETHKTTENEYEIPKTTITTAKKGERIKQMTVAVVVNELSKEMGGPWTPEQLKNMESLVKSAVGARNDLNASTGREDKITVVTQQFVVAETPQVAPITERTMDSIRSIVDDPLVRPIFGIVVLLGMIFFLRGQFRKEELQAAEIHGEPYGGVDGDGLRLGAGNSLALASIGEQSALVEGDGTRALDKIKVKSSEDPAMVAGAMEAWVNNLGEEAKG